MPKHITNCLSKKQEKQRKKKEAKDARDAAARKERAGSAAISSGDEEGGAGAKKTASKTGGLTASKKRKAAEGETEEAGGAKKKKKKDEAKTKAPRPKAPVDVEKQCGVELPMGGQCARSLTCKSHSMGAKRAVPGRSAPYDKLLLEYQRKNQARQQKAAFDANAPNPDDDMLPSGPVDSEEEKEAVMASIRRGWGSAPIYQAARVPLRQKYQFNRVRGRVQSAFPTGMRGGGGFFSSAALPPPTAVLGGGEGDGMGMMTGLHHARKGSVVPGARSMLAPSSVAHTKKGSIVGGA
jgi:SAGA-associated factor 73